MKNKTQKPDPDDLRKRYQSLAERLADPGLLLLGTITERRFQRKTKREKKAVDYGPYYQWTFKVEGKTHTVNLSKEQAPLFQEAIDNNREIETILKEMRTIARDILEATTKGVKRLKTKS